MLVNYIMTQLEEEEEKNAKVLSEDAVKLLDNIKTTEEKTANVVINPEAIIKITTDKITAGTEVRHNNFQKAIESFMTIEAVRANLKVVNEDNFTNLCCKEFIESFENKPTSQPFWLFLREMFINLTNEIEAYFKSDKIQKVLNETYIERLSNSDLSNNIGFVEKVFVKTGSSMDIETKVSDTVSPTKQFLDFPDSIYNDPITIFDEIQNKYEDVNLVSSALMSIKDAAPEGVVDNRKESAPVYMKKYNINEKQKSLKKKVYLLSFRVFEGIAVQYLDKKETYDLDTKKCLNIIKGYSRINPDTNIDYFSAFVLAAFEHINYDPNRNEYIKVLLHLVTEKKEKASVKVETIMNIKKLIKEVDKTSLDELVDKYAKMRLRTPKEKVSYKGTSSSSSVSKRKKKTENNQPPSKKIKTGEAAEDKNKKQTGDAAANKNKKQTAGEAATNKHKKPATTIVSKETTSSSSSSDDELIFNSNYDMILDDDKNDGGNKEGVTKGLNKISKNLFGDEEELLGLTHNYIYGGTEFENKVGLMIYLNDLNKQEFDEILKSFKMTKIEEFLDKVKQLNIFKLFLKTPPDEYAFTTKGDGYCMLRMAYQIVRKYITCHTYIDKEAWRKLDLEFDAFCVDPVKQNESINQLLDFITAARESIIEKINSYELGEEKLTWFDQNLQPVISTLKSTQKDKRLSPDKYLPDDMFFHFITNKNITYALFTSITRLDDYNTEYGKIFKMIPEKKWLFLQWFSSQSEVYNNCSNDDGFTYEQIKTILTCGNNIQHTGIHYNWAGDFVPEFSSNFTTKAIKDFHICLSKLICKMMKNCSNVIPEVNSIDPIFLDDYNFLNDLLNSELKPEAILLNTLQNSLKDDETENTTKEFIKNIEIAQQERDTIKLERDIVAQERDKIKFEFDNFVHKKRQEDEAAKQAALKKKEERKQENLKAQQEYLKAQQELEELREYIKDLEGKLKTKESK